MIELPSPEVDWFAETYGGSSLSWILSALLTEFKKAHVMNPQEYSTLAATEVKRRIEEKLE